MHPIRLMKQRRRKREDTGKEMQSQEETTGVEGRNLHFLLTGALEPIPAVLEGRKNCSLDKMPVHHWGPTETNTAIYSQ